MLHYSDNRRMLILPYATPWRLYRQIMHEAVQNKAPSQYQPIQARDTARPMLHLIRSPDLFKTC